MARFRKSNEALRQDLPLISETFDSVIDLMVASGNVSASKEREWIIKAGVVAGGIALIFPPFYFQGAGGARLGLGHSLILSPPKISPDNPNSHAVGAIDGVGLIAILAGIALITWAATLVRWRR